MTDSLIPVVTKGFFIPQTADQEERAKLTLKQLRELAKSKEISILGPKGGYLQKKPLLKKIEEFFAVEEKEKQAEIEAKIKVIREHNQSKIEFEEKHILVLKRDVTKARVSAQKYNKHADKLEAEIEELRILIQAWKKEYQNL